MDSMHVTSTSTWVLDLEYPIFDVMPFRAEHITPAYPIRWTYNSRLDLSLERSFGLRNPRGVSCLNRSLIWCRVIWSTWGFPESTSWDLLNFALGRLTALACGANTSSHYHGSWNRRIHGHHLPQSRLLLDCIPYETANEWDRKIATRVQEWMRMVTYNLA